MVRSNLSRLAGMSALLMLGACAGLDVKNPNNPDITRALASGEDVKNIAISTVNTWYLASTHYEPYMMLEVTADARTANFGNFGMRFNNLEPRIAYENNSAGGDREATARPWRLFYGALGASNDVLKALDGGVQISNGLENDKWKAVATFSQAASLANLAILFDSAFIVDEDFDATAGAPTLSGYKDVNAAAMTKWDALIALLNGKSDSYAAPVVLPVTTFTLNSGTLQRLANTMAALTLRLRERRPADLPAAGDAYWTKILGYADKGISGNGLTSFDVTVQGDNNNWYSYIAFYGAEASWTRVDYRLVNRMDAQGGAAGAVPIRYSGASDIRAPGNPATNDQRLGNGDATRDYDYKAGVIGDPSRGIYMQSAYSHRRYIHHSRFAATAAQTPVPYILAAENDLLIAEALIKTAGSKTRAATLINKTRVTRGGLAALTGAESDAVLLEAIDYERDVELLTTNGFGYAYARTAPVASPLGANTNGGRLQPGTFRHMPIPAGELEILKKAVYTYGGSGSDMMVVGEDGSLITLRRPARPARPAEMFFRQ